MEDRQVISPRKAEILQLVSLGFTAREIADTLFLSVRTVENHLYQVQQILGTRSAAHSVGVALRRKLFE